jgi:hypothetical protein
VQDAGAPNGDDGADGDEADAVLMSEPGQRRPTAQRRERASASERRKACR